MPDGRRRITPICVSKPGDYDQPKPYGSCSLAFDDKAGYTSSIGFGSPPSNSQTSELKSKTNAEQSTIIVEKRDERDEIVEISQVRSILHSKADISSKSKFKIIRFHYIYIECFNDQN